MSEIEERRQIQRFRIEFDDDRDPYLLSNDRVRFYLDAGQSFVRTRIGDKWADSEEGQRAALWYALALACAGQHGIDPSRARIYLDLANNELAVT